MKAPQNEPYQRSRHRAALHAWVVAATAVASIGMPSVATALNPETRSMTASANDQAPAQAAQQAARHWLDALRRGDVGSALSAMRLPRHASNERDAIDEAAALADWLHETGTDIQPVDARQAGHWALTTWRLGEDTFIEPITLYHPAADGLQAFGDGLTGPEATGDWQVVPQGMADDPAFAPLYNADHASLVRWYDATS